MMIDDALEEVGGNVSAAARKLGVSRARLDYRIGKRKKT
jgi:ActR/RegA family two-component response regulator